VQQANRRSWLHFGCIPAHTSRGILAGAAGGVKLGLPATGEPENRSGFAAKDILKKNGHPSG